MKLSDTALIVLNSAAGRDDRLVPRRASVPPVADVNACRALVKQGLVEVVRAPLGAADIVTVREDDCSMAFVIADAGFRALNVEPPGSAEAAATDAATGPQEARDGKVAHDALTAENAAAAAPTQPDTTADAEAGDSGALGEDEALGAPVGPHAGTDATDGHDAVAKVTETPDVAPVVPTDAAPARTTLRQAATAVLAAWDDEARATDIIAALDAPIATLRGLLAGRAPRPETDAPRKPREGTKQQAVLTMLRRAEGATVAQVMEATGWASHTVRGFFAGLKKKGIPVEVKDRVKQVGPDQQGAKGSYTIYHVTSV